ncbi:MAG TPA: glycosyltransferase family 1 protein [Rhizomicrobium sp.]|jgi:glycosyltransferase involved in cell wall biosynthesis|nr:glycosyltransferase family 1 protein [Rhizomicrobium sp.]
MSAGSVPAPRPHASAAKIVRLLIVTDAWAPQINGVVRTLETLGRDLTAMGHEVRYATPESSFTVPMPTYPEIRLALFPRKSLEKLIDEFRPTAIHIATEGSLGLSARAICLKRKLPFTTSFHTRFPEYVHARVPFIPERAIYRVLRWFHRPAAAMMVATPSLKRELEGRGFANLRLWSRGVDVEAFRPVHELTLPFPRPIWLYVGRIAVEKNIEAFLALNLPGTKVLIGDGPARAMLERRYSGARFLGPKLGQDLVQHYSASDVFVFPSRTDTFGLVLLEALACGVPVAAFPVQGPLDVIGDSKVGVLDEDLRRACISALEISHQDCRNFALSRSWRACTQQFLSNLPECYAERPAA